ncbi:MAG TPA: ISNCY family transposase, partial [Tepidisphaeraceae bacterium]|nr:ISNCY family transposase [Tepidisphaeraceae bacterium]
MGERLAMSAAERRRVEVMSRVRDGQLTVAAAAAALGVSERQAWRLKARYAAAGDAGLVHRLRGRASNRTTDGAARAAAALARYRAAYAGFGPTLACEYLAADGYDVSHDALGRWLRAAGLFEPRRKRGTHRLRRPRRERAGELVQMDGSWHDWLGGRGPWCCLMVLVDDATGRVLARFYDRETQAAAFDAFGRYAAARGLPRAVYVDKAGIYRADVGTPPTQFGRAMGELGVELILANGPQAKGRVERMNGTLQDRLAKALGLRGASTVAAANAVLDGRWLDAFNDRFAVPAARTGDAHRRVPAGVRLDEVLCAREARAVGRDWCVRWRGRILQVDARHAALDLPRPGRRVEVTEKADGQLLVRHRGADLTWREVAAPDPRPAAAKPRTPVTNNAAYR